MIKKIATSALIGSSLLTSAIAADDIRTLSATWDGSGEGNSATATATFDLDLTAINMALNANSGDAGFNIPLAGYISNLTLTVSGASSGNGTFTDSDFDGFVIQTSFNGTDYSLDVTGNWAANVNLVDFNLFSGSSAPNGSDYKQLTTNGGAGDPIDLVTANAVPEPSSLALVGMGGLGAFFLSRRRK